MRRTAWPLLAPYRSLGGVLSAGALAQKAGATLA